MACVFDASELNACRHIVRHCDQQYAWGLDAITCEYYVRTLTPLMRVVAPERRAMLVVHYHLDHRIVAALRDVNHPAHHDLWAQWSRKVLAVLRRSGLDWSHDSSIELDDLVQVALGELAQALPNYRYQSRFLSWAYSVIVRTAHRHLRTFNTRHHVGSHVSLERLEEAPPTEALKPHHEETTHARLLAARVHALLAAHNDARLLPIFRLWALEQYTSAEIGALVDLHESRVRALLNMARTVLREDPSIQQWRAASDDRLADSR
ncbi:RNA polymerase sigma factor [Candidatus Viridilinea mediisalina]|uniref:RNA polymerase sigma-70 region 2 domain-containing protein n=1 Tax=Candidatus Viridilinea mediisalina TaxID=2024553 RepID=A0A2A6RIV8_9CHLR|nr:sigma-70 family RNA polymerase sigma factor [Candidatus Viridilinea mediisalina]PDW03007.1 hypothetical protein CJ255_11090 [Candidatus Viridilinea mediisalina]